MKIAVAMDSFKGCLGSGRAGDAVLEGIRRAGLDAARFLLADGGEGTAMAVSEGMDVRSFEATGPLKERVRAEYYALEDKAVIDIAASSGLPLVPEDKKEKGWLLKANTRGFGEAILDAIEHGARDITLCLGGSGTNDLGAGMLSALGAKFYDAAGKTLEPVPSDLLNASSCDLSLVNSLIEDIKIRALCDVTNPLLGDNGAARIFGRLKGADMATSEVLESFGKSFAGVLSPGSPTDIAGYGAAGGMGFCIAEVLGGELIPGAPYVISKTGLLSYLEGADILITGEGRADKSSLGGKAAFEACKTARLSGVDLRFVIAGSADIAAEEFGATAIVSLPEGPSMLDPDVAYANIANASYELMRGLNG